MAGFSVTPDGINPSNRVEGKTLRALHGKVVDTILEAPTYLSRLMGKAKPFRGVVMDWTIKYQQSSQFEWFTGLENLNSSAEDNEITLSFAHTAGTQPKVSIMLESFANAGAEGVIPLDAYKHEEAGLEVVDAVAEAAYSTGAGDTPNGLQAIVDNGTNAATIGGQTRSSYDVLDATYTSWGTMTLAKLATLDDACAKGGGAASVPNINLTTFADWSLYEELLDPQVRANYNSGGWPRMSVRGEGSADAKLGGAAGFLSLHHRGMPAIKDKKATPGVWYKLNESSFGWFGRTVVPTEYAKLGLEKINLGSLEGMESLAKEEMPSAFNGWFYQPPLMMPDQAGTIARFYVIGQIATWRPNLNGQGHSITGV